MDKGTDLGCLKRGALALLGAETVAHEVAEVAGVGVVHTAGRHGQFLSVESLHRSGGQFSLGHGAGTLHGIQYAVAVSTVAEILPQALVLCRQTQGRTLQPQAIFAILAAHTQLREQPHHALHHEGGPQLRSGAVAAAPADMQVVGGLGEAGIDILQLVVQWIEGGVGQGQVTLTHQIAGFFIQNSALRLNAGQHRVIGAQQEHGTDAVTIVAGDLTDLHLIQRGRNGTHTVAAQYQTQQTGKLLAAHLLAA